MSEPPVRGRAADALDWIRATGTGRVLLSEPPTLVTRVPAQPRGALTARLDTQRRFVAPGAYVAEIPDASVWGSEGTVVTSDGCLLADLTRAWGRAEEHHPMFAAHAPGAVSTLRGTAAVVAARGADRNFSHFLADTLPRIQLVRDSGAHVDHWIVSGDDHRWQHELLRLVGIAPEQVVVIGDETTAIQAGALLVPSRTGFAPRTAPWARARLRAMLPTRPPAGRRILISRASAVRRRLLDESVLAAALAPLEFELLDFDRIAVADQIAAVTNAEIIIAPHGAALGHLLHSNPGGRIYEICHPAAIHPDYWSVAELAGWQHRFVPTHNPHDCKEGDAVTADWTLGDTTIAGLVRMIREIAA